MAVAGSIVVDLIARTGQFETDIKRSEKRMREMSKEAKAAGKAIGTAFATAATVTAGAIAKWTADSVRLGDEIRRLSELSNVGAVEFQKYAAGAERVGIDAGKLADVFKDVQDKVGDFLQTGGGPLKDFFENIAPKIGLTAEELASMSGPQALGAYVSALEKANLTQSEMVFFMEALASDSALLLPLLKDNAKGFRDYGDAAAAAGAIMDKDALAASLRLKGALDDLDLVMKGFRLEVAEGVTPAIEDFARELNSDATREGLKTLAEGLVGISTAAIQAASGFGNFIGKYKQFLADRGLIEGRTIQQLEARRDALVGQRGSLFANITGSNTEIGKEIARIGNLIEAMKRPDFSNVIGGSDVAPTGAGGGGGRPATRGASGRSREATEAEKLAEALKKQAAAERDLLALHSEMDAARFDAIEGWTQITAQLEGPLAEAELAHRERLAEIARLGHDAGKSFEEIAQAQALATQMHQESTAALQDYMEALANPELVDAMDGLRGTFRGLLGDLREGEGLWDALGNAAERFLDILFEISAQRLAESLFGKQGTTGGGTWGDAIGSVIGSFFGGSRQGGGDVGAVAVS